MGAVQTQIDRITTEVDSQTELINLIALALEGKSVPAGQKTTATASDILWGKTALNSKGEKLTGTIPAQEELTITPGTASTTIDAGVFLKGVITVLGDANLVPGNIVKGKTIFGVTGTYEGSGGGGGSTATGIQYSLSATAPDDTNLFWVDTGNGNLLKVYDADGAAWVPVSAAYG